MKTALALIALVATGCTGRGVLTLGPNRYRITEEAYAAATAEAAVATQAQAYCGARDQQAEIRLADVRPSVGYGYASASAEFSCVPRRP